MININPPKFLPNICEVLIVHLKTGYQWYKKIFETIKEIIHKSK